jgi:hypothetical protein
MKRIWLFGGCLLTVTLFAPKSLAWDYRHFGHHHHNHHGFGFGFSLGGHHHHGLYHGYHRYGRGHGGLHIDLNFGRYYHRPYYNSYLWDPYDYHYYRPTYVYPGYRAYRTYRYYSPCASTVTVPTTIMSSTGDASAASSLGQPQRLQLPAGGLDDVATTAIPVGASDSSLYPPDGAGGDATGTDDGLGPRLSVPSVRPILSDDKTPWIAK